MIEDRPRIFIGYDKNETVAAYTLAHSIQRNARGLVDVIILNKKKMPFYTRPRGELDSTDFSVSRFLVPYLCNYSGYAIFMDCDCLACGDVYDIWDLRKSDEAVKTVHHRHYKPKEEIKFLGNIQTCYSFKNWTSVMLFNNPLCKALTLQKLNNPGLSGLYFHQFKWLSAKDKIGELPPEWNILVGEQEIPENPKLLHYTQGGPYFEQFKRCTAAGLWFEEFSDMVYANTGFLHEKVKWALSDNPSTE